MVRLAAVRKDAQDLSLEASRRGALNMACVPLPWGFDGSCAPFDACMFFVRRLGAVRGLQFLETPGGADVARTASTQ